VRLCAIGGTILVAEMENWRIREEDKDREEAGVKEILRRVQGLADVW
jgi:hypothetical protein